MVMLYSAVKLFRKAVKKRFKNIKIFRRKKHSSFKVESAIPDDSIHQNNVPVSQNLSLCVLVIIPAA